MLSPKSALKFLRQAFSQIRDGEKDSNDSDSQQQSNNFHTSKLCPASSNERTIVEVKTSLVRQDRTNCQANKDMRCKGTSPAATKGELHVRCNNAEIMNASKSTSAISRTREVHYMDTRDQESSKQGVTARFMPRANALDLYHLRTVTPFGFEMLRDLPRNNIDEAKFHRKSFRCIR